MRNTWADEFERGHHTRACLRGIHGDCPHLHGLGGGFNPRRLRLEFGAGLCKCDCHSSCPVASARITVSFQAWRESCTCPGAEAERTRHDRAGTNFPDFEELRASSWRRNQLLREAFETTRASAAGKTREEVKALYVAELRSRGLELRQEDVPDAFADAITGSSLTSARLLGRSVVSLGKLLGALRPRR